MNLIHKILLENIVPFWKGIVDKEYGGFYGRAGNDGIPVKDAPKGLIQHARLLSAFSILFSRYSDRDCQQMAYHAYEFIISNFSQYQNGGWNYLVDFKGEPLDTRNHMYAYGALLKGFSDFYSVFSEEGAKEFSNRIFSIIEDIAYDKNYGGYHECFSSDFQKLDQIEGYGTGGDNKTLATHMNILEGYSQYLTCVPGDIRAHKGLKKNIDLIIDHFYDKKNLCFHRYLSSFLEPLPSLRSYPHDIGSGWLLWEAASLIEYRIDSAEEMVLKIITQVGSMGLDLHEGGLYFQGERESGTPIKKNKVWWAQADALMGFIGAYSLSGEQKFYNAFINVLDWLKSDQIDLVNGEWFDVIYSDHRVGNCKVSNWKTPYKSTRACLKALDFLKELNIDQIQI